MPERGIDRRSQLSKGKPDKAAKIEAILRKAEHAFAADKFGKAHKLLEPLVKKQVPEAMFMAAHFGKPGEADEAFRQRYLWLLTQAAMRDHAEAIYELGVQYDTGVDQIKNKIIASALFEQAAVLGHSRGKLMHGLDLMRGLNRIPQDIERGLELIRQAAAANEEGAAEELEWFMAKADNGSETGPDENEGEKNGNDQG